MSNEKNTKPEDETAVAPIKPAFDTTNRFLVTMHGEKVMVMTVGGMRGFSKLEILSLIAWSATLAELSLEEIEGAIEAVKSC